MRFRLWLGVLLLTASSLARAAIFQSFADVAESALPGVVNIRTTSYIQRNDPSLDLYQFFLNGKVPQSLSTHAMGSGIVIDSRGYILTNRHVIEGASAIEVLFVKSKNKYRVAVVGTDPKTDLALLKIRDNIKVTPLDLGDSDALRIGDIVLAIGNPFGYSHTVTSGIISAKGRVIGTGPYDDFLQTDASIHPGNSGGPLLDIRGRVIGVNTAVSSEGPGIGFAIPINIAKKVVKDLIDHGKVIRPWLGMMGKNILSREELETGAESGNIYGVIVSNLVIEGPAHKAGIRIGDLVMTLDDIKIQDLNHFQKLLSSKTPNDSVRLKLYRRGKGIIQATIKLEATPKAEELPAEKDLF